MVPSSMYFLDRPFASCEGEGEPAINQNRKKTDIFCEPEAIAIRRIVLQMQLFIQFKVEISSYFSMLLIQTISYLKSILANSKIGTEINAYLTEFFRKLL